MLLRKYIYYTVFTGKKSTSNQIHTVQTHVAHRSITYCKTFLTIRLVKTHPSPPSQNYHFVVFGEDIKTLCSQQLSCIQYSTVNYSQCAINLDTQNFLTQVITHTKALPTFIRTVLTVMTMVYLWDIRKVAVSLVQYNEIVQDTTLSAPNWLNCQQEQVTFP